MSVQTISYNFEDLRNLSAEKLVESIPLEQAIQMTLHEIYKTSEVSQYETYHSWATSLFRRYGPSNVNGSDLNQLFEMFLSAIREILDEYQGSGCDAANTKIISFLNYSLELFNWIRTEARAFCNNTITTFICFGLSLVNNCLVIGHKKLLEKSLALHTVILTILSENSKTFCFDDDHDSFTNLITHLCDVGELAPKLDIKSAVDTWKIITKISSQNISQAQNIRGPLDDNAWLRRPMLFLLNEICRNVKTVYNKNSLTEPIKQIEKYLKVTNFYVRLLQKLTIDFEHILFPVCEDFLKALAVIITPPVFIIHTPVHKVVTSLITKGFREIIPYAYKNGLLFELLLTKTIEDTNIDKAFYEIYFEVLEQIIQRNEVDCLRIQLLDVAFERISISPLILSDSTYNRFIELVSTLQVHCRLKEVEEILVNNVLQEDIILALTAIDVWCISFRVSDQNTRLLYFQFWRKINESFATFSNQIPAIYVETLLSTLYDILTAQEKVEVWSNFNTFALNNDRFMIVISLNAIPIDSTKQSTVQHFIIELVRFLKECSTEMTVDNFYTIVKNIKLLTPIAFRNDGLISMLLQYFCVAVKSEQLCLLVESILDFITAKLEFIDDAKVITVLTALSGELSSFTSNSMKSSLIRFLKRVSKLPRLEKHSQEMLKAFNSDELVTFFESKELITTNGINLEENKDFLQQFIESNSTAKFQSEHICKSSRESSVKAAAHTGAETEILLETIENNVNKLQYLTQTKQQCVSQTTIRTIERVVNKLQNIGTLS